MEIKRIFIVLFVVILATGCTKNYTCSKEEKSNEFDYSIQMNLIFDGTKIKNVKSDIKYILTDKGMESIDNLEKNLSNKSLEYSLYDEINFDYKITEKLIEVSEEISFVNKNKTDIEKLFRHKDLSIVYFDSKYKLDDVIKSLEENNFKCNINK